MEKRVITQIGSAMHKGCTADFIKEIILIISLAIVLYYSTILFRKIIKLLDPNS
ncbi:hypothetical protein OX284_012265 [Flavobacterium sp. SUN046]|uniref:hypothetical protein n=1 Tax=Flavobacterium sp. SUN046 TaxID=3002440 RepID=UPI002DBF640B|nr:hypothetical protein [Flavobacterium sp. SUN046]MEC4050208.1 hypothetical protein [Flavobacterium sp. SUN046]